MPPSTFSGPALGAPTQTPDGDRVPSQLRVARTLVVAALRTRLVALWRRATLSTLIAICLTFLVLAGVADSIVAQGWASAAIGLAGNIAASGIVAAATVAGFVIGTRRRAYVRVLTLQRRQNRLSTPSGRHLAEWRGLARAAVAQLKDVKQPGYLFVEALDARDRKSVV